MKRSWWPLIWAVVGLFVMDFAAMVWQRHRIEPRGIETLRDYAAWRSASKVFAVEQKDGRAYAIAYGPIAIGAIFLGSGPAVYVFDDQGRFVEWSPDSGDDSTFQSKWLTQRIQKTERQLSLKEIQQWGTVKEPEGN